MEGEWQDVSSGCGAPGVPSPGPDAHTGPPWDVHPARTRTARTLPWGSFRQAESLTQVTQGH